MVYVCVFFTREHPKAQLIVVMVKLGIEPATPGLQGIALIHYTTAASYYIVMTIYIILVTVLVTYK